MGDAMSACGNVWEFAGDLFEPCHLKAGHPDGCAYRDIAILQPDAADRLDAALTEARAAFDALKLSKTPNL